MIKTLLMVFITVICSAQTIVTFDDTPYQKNTLKELRGTSIHWVEDGDGLQLSRTTSATAANDSIISSLRYNVLRIPGGYLTRWFNWEKAVGNRYGAERNYSGKNEHIKSGLQEMKQFAAKHSLKVMYTLTLSDPPEKVRRLIETWNGLEPKGRVPIEWFELGNEDYDADSSADAARRYAETVQPLISVIRRISPSAKIGAIVANPVAPSWDTTVYALLYNNIDFLVWHRYVPYADYSESDSYQKTVASFETISNEALYLQQIMKTKPLPIYLTEFNLSYYGKDKKHQNVVLEPRYNILAGNFVPFALTSGISGMVKFTLASAGYHMFADMNFIGKEAGMISTGGVVWKYLNRWIEEQDSVFVQNTGPSLWEFSVVKGKNTFGYSCLIQNHTSAPVSIRFEGISSASVSSVSLFQHRTTMWTERKDGTKIDDVITVAPYSLNIFDIKHH